MTPDLSCLATALPTLPQKFWDDLPLTLVDKGLLALLILLAGVLLNRSIEKYKHSLAWGQEVLKQRMTYAIELFDKMNALSDAYGIVRASQVLGAPPQNYVIALVTAMGDLDRTCAKAGPLLLPRVTEAVRAVGTRANELVGNPTPALSAAPLPPGADPKLILIDPAVQAAMQKDRQRLQEKIALAIHTIGESFPRPPKWLR